MKISRPNMSLAIAFCMVAIGTGFYFGSRSLRAPSPKPVAGSAAQSVVIPIKGMSCLACAAKTKQALRSASGIAEVEVNFEPGSGIVRYDGSLVTPHRSSVLSLRLFFFVGLYRRFLPKRKRLCFHMPMLAVNDQTWHV